MGAFASTRDRHQQELASLEALNRAIAAAIVALEKNDVHAFERHVSAQEAICNGFITTPPSCLADLTGSENSELAAKVRQAYAAVARINRVYAAVVKRAKKTIGMMEAIYRAAGQGYTTSRPSSTEQNTWSCEA